MTRARLVGKGVNFRGIQGISIFLNDRLLFAIKAKIQGRGENEGQLKPKKEASGMALG